MQGKTLYTILLSIIAVLTLALAVMVIFLFTTFNNGKAGSGTEIDEQIIERAVPPDEQAELNLYATGAEAGTSGDAVFNIKSTAAHPSSFLMASISIVYDAGKKNKLLEDRKKLLEKIYLSELKQATIEYFRDQTYDDLQSPDAMKNGRDALKEIYSKIVNEEAKEQIIIRIVFDKWIIQ